MRVSHGSGSGASPVTRKVKRRNGMVCPRCRRFGTFAPNAIVCDRCLGALPLIFAWLTVEVTVIIVGGGR